MVGVGSLVFLLLVAGNPVSGEVGECTCDTTTEIGSWCELHRVGRIGSVEVASRLLFDTLDAHGHDVDPETFSCETCREAIDSNGFCEKHRIGFVLRQAYFSTLTYRLAQGRRAPPSEPACPVCARNARSHGWCAACRVGRVGRFLIDGERAYDDVRRALSVLAIAQEAATTCEHCAVAIVTDTECPICRIRYRDGRPVPAGSAGAEPR